MNFTPAEYKEIKGKELTPHKISGSKLAANRVAYISGGNLTLCSSTTPNPIGITTQIGVDSFLQYVANLDGDFPITVETDLSSFAVGGVAYLASDGRVGSSGTVRVGVTSGPTLIGPTDTGTIGFVSLITD